MEMIKTTRTLVEKLAAEAKALSKSSQRKLMACQDEVAAKHGYHHWHHVQLSLKATQDATDTPTETSDPVTRALDSYFRWLSAQPAAAVLINEPKDEVFFDVTIDGTRFKGNVGANPSLSSDRSGGSTAPFGVSVICSVSEPVAGSPGGLAVCKYDPSQPRIPLGHLSIHGVVALARTFGLIVQPHLIPLSRSSEDSRLLLTNVYAPAYAFFRSPAAAALQAWCRAHPRLAKQQESRSDYLLAWHRYIGKDWPTPRAD